MTAMLTNSLARQFEQIPPNDIDAEAALIGSLALAGQHHPTWAEVRALVNRESFFQTDHQVVFDVLSDLYDAGKPIDILILRDELRRRGLLEELGGDVYLGVLLNTVSSYAHVAYYAKTVRRYARRRCLIAVSNAMLREAYAPTSKRDDGAEDDMIERAMADLAAAATVRVGKAQRLDAILSEVRAQMTSGGVPTITTGFASLDRETGGVGLGEMWLVCGRPSMGKSTWAKQCGIRAAKAGVPTAIISLEEGMLKIARNILAGEAQVENNRVRKSAQLHPQEWEAIDAGIAQLAGVPLFVVQNVRRLSDIRAEAAVLVARHGVRLLIVDYLQRVQAPGRDNIERAGAASEGLSDLFKDLNVAGIVPTQLNRGVEGRQDKRPTMADIRESGKIEQDADGILLLHREDYYHLRDANYTPTGIAELDIAKMRDGERGGSVKLKSNLRFQTFEEYDPFESTHQRGDGPGAFDVDDLPNY